MKQVEKDNFLFLEDFAVLTIQDITLVVWDLKLSINYFYKAMV